MSLSHRLHCLKFTTQSEIVIPLRMWLHHEGSLYLIPYHTLKSNQCNRLVISCQHESRKQRAQLNGAMHCECVYVCSYTMQLPPFLQPS